ncbi:MAG: hypothetical protein II968_05060 [Selenomonadaceae bacterium]|nr:hypothetical protein [Selenomonadaceae bacterium]
MSVNFFAMNRAIINYINSKIPKDRNNAVKGTYQGDNKVLIGNKSYDADLVSDMVYSKGDSVYCLLPDSGYTAAIVGK